MKSWVITTALCLFLSLNPGPLRADSFSLAVADNTIDTIVSEVIVKRAYDMLGHDVSIVRLPPKRALMMANHGTHDGDVQRIYTVADNFPNLIRIEPPINYIQGTGFVLRGSPIKASSWEDLKGYRVGIIQGIRFAETNVPEESAVVFYNYRDLATALLIGDIDIAIYPLSNGIFQTLLIAEEDIVPLDTPLATFQLYHYVHKKNDHLVPGLQQIFSQFEKDGTLEKVRTSVLERTFVRAAEGLEPCIDDYACYQTVWEPLE